MSEIIIDLGTDGQIIVESAGASPASTEDDSPTEKTGVEETWKKVKVNAEKVLKMPLTGLAKTFLAILPYAASNDEFQLDEFTVEFNLGLKAEAGSNVGAVAKVMPEGAFKCTYKWKHQPNQDS